MKISRKMTLLICAVVSGALIGAYRVLAVDPAHPGGLYYGLCGGVLALFGLMAVLQGSRPSPQTHISGTGFKTASVISSFMLFAASGIELISMFNDQIDILLACALALALISAFAFIFTASSSDAEKAGMFSVVPVFFMSIFLLQMYKEYAAACPNMNVYATEMVSVALMTLAAYAVTSMRFLGLSRSFVISFSIPGAIMLTSLMTVSRLLSIGRYDQIINLAQLAAVIAMAIYCAAWYLCPPVKYVRRDEADDSVESAAKDNMSFFDVEKHDAPVVPDIDSIIDEVKNSTDDSDKN